MDGHNDTQVRINFSYDGDITQRKRAKYLIGLKRLDGYFSYNWCLFHFAAINKWGYISSIVFCRRPFKIGHDMVIAKNEKTNVNLQIFTGLVGIRWVLSQIKNGITNKIREMRTGSLWKLFVVYISLSRLFLAVCLRLRSAIFQESGMIICASPWNKTRRWSNSCPPLSSYPDTKHHSEVAKRRSNSCLVSPWRSSPLYHHFRHGFVNQNSDMIKLFGLVQCNWFR